MSAPVKLRLITSSLPATAPARLVLGPVPDDKDKDRDRYREESPQVSPQSDTFSHTGSSQVSPVSFASNPWGLPPETDATSPGTQAFSGESGSFSNTSWPAYPPAYQTEKSQRRETYYSIASEAPTWPPPNDHDVLSPLSATTTTITTITAATPTTAQEIIFLQEVPDAICQRIRICSPGGDETPTAATSGLIPHWTPDRIRVLSAISPMIRAHVEELRQRSDRWWLPLVGLGDGFDSGVALRVLDAITSSSLSLPPAGMQQQSQNWRTNERVSVLCRNCNVMWFFGVVPRLLPACQSWQAVDDDDKHQVIASRNMPRQSAASSSRRWSQASLSSQASAPKWCWHSEPGHSARLTCLQIANIALVLQWDEVFRREIKTVVWDWTGTSQAVLHTPVTRLRTHGDYGLDARRKLEKEKILLHMRNYLHRHKDSHATSVKRINRDFKMHTMELVPDSFLHPSIYSMLREVEGAILKEKRALSGAQAGRPPPRTVNPNRPTTPGLLGKIKGMESSVEYMFSGGKPHRDFVIGFLADVHEYVAQQQEELAQDIWRWRHTELARWEPDKR
ncbi:hypothetical protein B0T24DRAFT_681937 [Lasiosphaeria ovina]|uniref:Uncharacterized protein n=1 Tax=Lasiosphaeria ovina TaxID=92902 RepID=A0AAE0N285_9PEZI|nr:hypothetical protein B0T24DRAFT_681937 [Lasiosphaeria ovina]